ncbi:MAG: hypothetical protein IJ498_09905 [Akkermansia sp.]|nr:hypothetical protein [Akkermansia sp.]
MKTSCLIRNMLLVGSLSLTLASCGGGGGGGESSSPGNDSSTNTPNTQEGYAPYNLSGCTMTYNHDGRPYTFKFDSSGKVEGKAQLVDTIINYTGTYTYSRSSDGQDATLELNTTSGKTSSGIEKTQTFDIELSFSSATQATALVSYTNTDSVNDNDFHENEDVYSVTATFSGTGVQDNGSSDGESNDDTTSDDSTQLAPDSLPVGTVINLHANSGTISSYTLNSDTNCTNNSGGKLTWEYSVTGDNTAEWVARNSLNIPLTYKLVFTSSSGGTYTYINAGGEASVSGSFNLSDKSDAPIKSDGPNADDTEDENSSGNAPQYISGILRFNATLGESQIPLYFFLSEPSGVHEITFNEGVVRWKTMSVDYYKDGENVAIIKCSGVSSQPSGWKMEGVFTLYFLNSKTASGEFYSNVTTPSNKKYTFTNNGIYYFTNH